ncbi:cytochrome c family protein [soil metagenome]
MKSIVQALVVSLIAVGTAAAEDAPLPPGNAEAGATVFKKCLACHQIGPTAKISVGPVLNGVVGRKAGTYTNYAYSPANKNSGITWDEATLAKYLPNPQAFLPGTKMTFAGLPKPQEVADVIAFLKQYDEAGNKK